MRSQVKSPDLIIYFVTLAIMTVGIVMVFSASSVMAIEESGDAYFYLKKQLVGALIGVVAMTLMMKIDYRFWKIMALPIFIGMIVLLSVVLLPGVGIMVGGSRRWLGYGSFRVQPSELAKLGMVIFLASYLSGIKDDVKSFFKGVLLPLLAVGLCFCLIMLEPDLGTGVAMVGVSMIMLFSAGANISHLGLVGSAGIAGIFLLIFSEPYRRERFLSFLHPWEDPSDSGYHIIQSLLAVGSGGFFGLGLGRSRQKFHYLPEQHTDFIFAVLAEELGFIGTLLVLCLFLLLVWRGLKIAIFAPDLFGSLMAVGITSMIVLQAVMNIGVVTGSIPVTGITLPLMSYGSSSLVITMASIGILLNISKHCRG